MIYSQLIKENKNEYTISDIYLLFLETFLLAFDYISHFRLLLLYLKYSINK